ncbi:MAG: hypothetical protein ACRDO1_15135, partial [Nocardioidaceae bacterium]
HGQQESSISNEPAQSSTARRTCFADTCPQNARGSAHRHSVTTPRLDGRATLIGLIGAPLLLTSNLLTFFGHNTQTGGWTMLATMPIAAGELSAAIGAISERLAR